MFHCGVLRWLAMMIAFLCLVGARGDEITLVGMGESWRYFKGTNEPAITLGAWKEVQFDDSRWTAGGSGFATLGSYNEQTSFGDYGNAYKTVYFRKSFTVTNLAVIRWLVLRIDYDDGFVAYLNGQEVARREVAGEPGQLHAVGTFAQPHFRGDIEEIDLSGRKELLVEGTNVLAVQVFGRQGFDFSFAMTAELLNNFIRGPFLQNTTTNSIQISWKTPFRSSAGVEFRALGGEPQVVSTAEFGTNHLVTLSELKSNTIYTYRVVNTDVRGGEIRGPEGTFKTFKLPHEGVVTFTAFGDCGSGLGPQYSVARAVRAVDTDLVMILGDVVYPGWYDWLSDIRCFSVYHQQMRSTPYFIVHGNHDGYGDPDMITTHFSLPTNNVTGTEHYYSFDHGDVHFVVLFTDFQKAANYSPGSPQYRWLEQDLAQTSRKWKFLFFHHNIRTSSYHAHDDYDWSNTLDMEQMEASIGVLASRYGVQAIFNGHDHDFERHTPHEGFKVFVSGGGGYPVYPIVDRHPLSARFISAFHFSKVTVDGEVARVQAIDASQRVIDDFEIRLNLPAPAARVARWHTPQVEATPANDTDGNIGSQRFELAGEPVPGRMGRYSNPGRLYVNNDNRFLYLGLDQVELQREQILYLFVEVPGRSGVSRLTGLGNHLTDPEGEGVEALDTLNNLEFVNFRPTFAAVLGDEFGDGTWRSFQRGGTNENIGQGVFHLERGFPTVKGVRMQQFNLSPQVGISVEERNAEFIELAIPMNELGLVHGAEIKVAVVTARGVALPGRERVLDNGAIAIRFEQIAAGTVVEGVPVRLTVDLDADDDGLTIMVEQQLGSDPNHPDSDRDGMPDGWEVEMNLHATRTDGIYGPLADADNDRFTNLAEYLAGTHARNAGSYLHVEVTMREAKTELEWFGVAGRRYQLERAGAVTGPFAPIEHGSFPRAGWGNWESFRDEEAAVEGERFYRLRLLDPE